jgi:Protein of unknown function (DUF1168)
MSDEKVRINKLQRVSSSAAGPGSDFFRHYRVHRDKEIDRLKVIEEREKDAKVREDEKSEVRMAQGRLEAKTAKNREKRHKRKEARRGLALPLDIREKIIQAENEERDLKLAEVHAIEPPANRRRFEESRETSDQLEPRHPGIRVILEDSNL